MGLAGDHALPDRWCWEQGADGVSRFVPAGDLDLDVLAELAAALDAALRGSAPVVEIDLRAVTFLDGGTGRLLARYRAAARRLGKEVRIVNAAGMPYKVLTVLGVPPLEGVAERSSRPSWQPLVDLRTVSSELVAVARSTIVRARELCSEVQDLREANERHTRE